MAPGAPARISVAFGVSGTLGVPGYGGTDDGEGRAGRSERWARFDLHGFSAVSPTSGFDCTQACKAVVPEPATWLLSLCGAAFFSVVRGRTRCAPARRPAQA